jgi:hypothetical protein
MHPIHAEAESLRHDLGYVMAALAALLFLVVVFGPVAGAMLGMVAERKRWLLSGRKREHGRTPHQADGNFYYVIPEKEFCEEYAVAGKLDSAVVVLTPAPPAPRFAVGSCVAADIPGVVFFGVVLASFADLSGVRLVMCQHPGTLFTGLFAESQLIQSTHGAVVAAEAH